MLKAKRQEEISSKESFAQGTADSILRILWYFNSSDICSKIWGILKTFVFKRNYNDVE